MLGNASQNVCQRETRSSHLWLHVAEIMQIAYVISSGAQIEADKQPII